MTDQTQVQWTADTIVEFLHAHRDQLRAMGVQKIGLFCIGQDDGRQIIILKNPHISHMRFSNSLGDKPGIGSPW